MQMAAWQMAAWMQWLLGELDMVERLDGQDASEVLKALPANDSRQGDRTRALEYVEAINRGRESRLEEEILRASVDKEASGDVNMENEEDKDNPPDNHVNDAAEVAHEGEDAEIPPEQEEEEDAGDDSSHIGALHGFEGFRER